MKILIATESYYPNISGVAVFSHNLAKNLVLKNNDVYVIAPSPNFKLHQEIVDKVKIYRLPSKINRFRNGYFISKNPFKYVDKIINDISPDVIHLQDPAMISVASMISAKRKNIPIVITNHFFLEYIVSYLPYLKPIHFLILLILTHYLNWFYAKADVLTCPTKTIADHFVKTGIKIKVEIISNGVDLGRFMPFYGDSMSTRNKFSIPSIFPIILYVGRLDKEKNIKNILLASSIVLSKHNAHFVIVGNGKEKNKLIKLSKSLNVLNSFTFIDFIPHDKNILPRIYQTSNIFINPCPIETQSIVVLEAEATGKPIIAANAGALIELVKDGINGFLFDPTSYKDLANKIIDILDNPKMAKEMGDKSLEIVEKHIVDNTYFSYEKIYKELVK